MARFDELRNTLRHVWRMLRKGGLLKQNPGIDSIWANLKFHVCNMSASSSSSIERIVLKWKSPRSSCSN